MLSLGTYNCCSQEPSSLHAFARTCARSIKLHTPETKKRSIAHFYRPCVIYPYVVPQHIFGSTEHPTEVRTEQGLGWSLTGEKGKVRVIAELPRPDWVAGQNVWIKIFADNQSQKKVWPGSCQSFSFFAYTASLRSGYSISRCSSKLSCSNLPDQSVNTKRTLQIFRDIPPPR